MRTKFLGIAAAVALCAATMSTDAPAAHGHGHWARGHFHNDFRHYTFSRSLPRHRFAPSVDFWGLGGGWWAGYHYCGGWAYANAMLPTAVTFSGVGNVIGD
jgi:hypothetical protein